MQPRGFRLTLDNTIKFLHDLDRARNVRDLAAQVLKHLSQLGAEHVIATPMPMIGTARLQQLGNVLFYEIPAEWMSRYASQGYAFQDPVIRRMKSLSAPFYWNELAEDVRDDRAGQRVLAEGSEFGLKNGFSTSFLTLEGQAIGFSVSGRHFEANAEMRGVLTLVANYAGGRAIALSQELSDQTKNINLSAREREVLHWASDGKNDWEIGEIMNISEHGVDKHLRSARAKLGAN